MRLFFTIWFDINSSFLSLRSIYMVIEGSLESSDREQAVGAIKQSLGGHPTKWEVEKHRKIATRDQVKKIEDRPEHSQKSSPAHGWRLIGMLSSRALSWAVNHERASSFGKMRHETWFCLLGLWWRCTWICGTHNSLLPSVAAKTHHFMHSRDLCECIKENPALKARRSKKWGVPQIWTKNRVFLKNLYMVAFRACILTATTWSVQSEGFGA